MAETRTRARAKTRRAATIRRSARAFPVVALLASLLASLPIPAAQATAPGEDGELVVSIYTSEYRVFTLNPDEINPSMVSVKAGIGVDSPGTNIHPTWSPSGMIAFSAFDTNSSSKPPRIYTVLSDGKNRTLLPSDRVADTQPAWSPKGDRIAFTTLIGGGAAAQCTNGAAGGTLVYGLDGDIYKQDPSSGSTASQLTDTSSFESAPNWRPDGSKVGFWRQSSGPVAMYEMDPDGQNQTALTPVPNGDQYGPSYSPDGTKVLYTAFDSGMSPDVWVRDLASGDTTNLSDNPAMDTSPEWSCDGSKVVFASYRGGNGNIYTIEPDGTGLQQLTDTGWDEDDPTYSPDGTKIAYRSDQHGDFDLMVMEADGSDAEDPLHLTASVRDEMGPSWSPDGTKLAFSSGTASSSDIYVMSATIQDSEFKVTNTAGFEVAPDWGPSTGETFIYTMKPDGTDPQKVTLPISGGYPAWSPDASRIAFSDKGDLFTIQPDGRGLAQLTSNANNTGSDIEPSYSPDGAKVAYTGVASNGTSSVYTVNVNGGTGLFNVTKGTADRSPVWSPSGTRIAFVRNGDIYTIKPDGTGLKLIKEVSPDARFISLDWGTGGPPDTTITTKPGEAVGDNSATFKFRASRYPASFECRLSSSNGWPGLHDYRDCGSMAASSSAEPIVSYQSLAKGHYTFYVRAKNAHGTDASPASWQFESFPPGLTVVKEGSGTGLVKSDPSGIRCTPEQTQCTSDKFSGKTVKLEATADKGSEFVKWTDGCTGTKNVCSVKVGNKPVFVHAHFELKDSGGYCNEAPETTKKVGAWYLTGCFKGSGTTFTTTEPMKLDGINLLPKGRTFTLDTAGQTLSSDGVIQMNAGPVKTSTQKIGPFTLFDDELYMDLSQAQIFTFPKFTEVLGVPISQLVVLDAGADGVTLTMPTQLPAVLGGGDGLLQFFSDRTGGLKSNTFKIGRLNPDTSAIEYPFTAGIAQTFNLEEVTIIHTADGWKAGGNVVLAGTATGNFSGTLNYANGAYSGGSFTLTNVGLGGVVYVPELRLSSSDGLSWDLADASNRSLPGGHRPRQAAVGQDCGSQLTGQIQLNPVGIMNGANITVPTCQLFGQSLIVNNLVMGPTFGNFFGIQFPTGYSVTGTLAGQAAGTVTGNIGLSLPGVQACVQNFQALNFACAPPIANVTLNTPQMTFADDLFTATNLTLNLAPDAAGTGWDITGTGTLAKDWYGNGNVAFDANVQGLTNSVAFNVTYARLTANNFGLFQALDQSTGQTNPLINVRRMALTYVPSQNLWGIDGSVTGPGADVSGITGTVRLTNAGQVSRANLEVKYAKLIGYIEVNDLKVNFKSARTWDGSATVVLPGVIQVAAGVGLKNNQLVKLAADVQFGQPLPIALIPHTGIYRVGFQWQDNINFGGNMGLQAGPTIFGVRPITADGAFLIRYENSGIPGFRIDGDVKLMGYKLSEGYVDYTHPRSIGVGGCLGSCTSGLTIGPAKVKAVVEGKYRSNPFAFQVSGEAEAGIHLATPCFIKCGTIDIDVVGKAILSNIGAAICGGIVGWSTDWTAGMGYKWGGSPEVFKGCDLGPYKSIKAAPRLIARTTAPTDDSTYRLRMAAADDLPVKAFRFVGKNAPPLIDLHRPSGGTISVSENTLGQHEDYLIAVDDDTNETIILVDKPEEGEWTATLQEGSSPLKDASDSDGLGEAAVSAEVTGDGATRTLSWELTPIEGQTVRFIETGEDTSQVITETNEATGSIEFTPAVGMAGTRTIVAEIVQNGLPRETLEVATYEAEERNMLLVQLDGTGAGSVTSDPAGIDCGQTCEMDLATEVTLTATSAAGSRFVGWSGSCGGTETCTISADESTAVTATFARVHQARDQGVELLARQLQARASRSRVSVSPTLVL